jgi:uncharacterized membrane protein
MSTRQTGSSQSKLEIAISYMLIAGVVLSLVLEVIGVALMWGSYRRLDISQDPSLFIQGRNFFTFAFETIANRHPAGPGIAFMTAGIIVLILTPYSRVVASVFYFAAERNLRYVLITLFVLIVVTLSLALH